MHTAFKQRGDDFHITATPALVEFLQSHHIFLAKEGTKRFKPNTVLVFPSDGELQPYTGYYGGAVLHPMGVFSYSSSDLPRYVRVGRYGSIASGIETVGAKHPYERISSFPFTYLNATTLFKSFRKEHNPAFREIPMGEKDLSIRIGHDVWIGRDALLSPGITIGNGAVIAARSVVTKDVLPYTVVGGIPARPIKQRFDDTLIERLERTQWWRFAYTDFEGMDFTHPHQFLDQLEEKIAQSAIQPYEPTPLRVQRIVEFIHQHAETTAAEAIG